MSKKRSSKRKNRSKSKPQVSDSKSEGKQVLPAMPASYGDPAQTRVLLTKNTSSIPTKVSTEGMDLNSQTNRKPIETRNPISPDGGLTGESAGAENQAKPLAIAQQQVSKSSGDKPPMVTSEKPIIPVDEAKPDRSQKFDPIGKTPNLLSGDVPLPNPEPIAPTSTEDLGIMVSTVPATHWILLGNTVLPENLDWNDAAEDMSHGLYASVRFNAVNTVGTGYKSVNYMRDLGFSSGVLPSIMKSSDLSKFVFPYDILSRTCTLYGGFIASKRTFKLPFFHLERLYMSQGDVGRPNSYYKGHNSLHLFSVPSIVENSQVVNKGPAAYLKKRFSKVDMRYLHLGRSDGCRVELDGLVIHRKSLRHHQSQQWYANRMMRPMPSIRATSQLHQVKLGGNVNTRKGISLDISEILPEDVEIYRKFMSDADPSYWVDLLKTTLDDILKRFTLDSETSSAEVTKRMTSVQMNTMNAVTQMFNEKLLSLSSSSMFGMILVAFINDGDNKLVLETSQQFDVITACFALLCFAYFMPIKYANPSEVKSFIETLRSLFKLRNEGDHYYDRPGNDGREFVDADEITDICSFVEGQAIRDSLYPILDWDWDRPYGKSAKRQAVDDLIKKCDRQTFRGPLSLLHSKILQGIDDYMRIVKSIKTVVHEDPVFNLLKGIRPSNVVRLKCSNAILGPLGLGAHCATSAFNNHNVNLDVEYDVMATRYSAACYVEDCADLVSLCVLGSRLEGFFPDDYTDWLTEIVGGCLKDPVNKLAVRRSVEHVKLVSPRWGSFSTDLDQALRELRPYSVAKIVPERHLRPLRAGCPHLDLCGHLSYGSHDLFAIPGVNINHVGFMNTCCHGLRSGTDGNVVDITGVVANELVSGTDISNAFLAANGRSLCVSLTDLHLNTEKFSETMALVEKFPVIFEGLWPVERTLQKVDIGNSVSGSSLSFGVSRVEFKRVPIRYYIGGYVDDDYLRTVRLMSARESVFIEPRPGAVVQLRAHETYSHDLVDLLDFVKVKIYVDYQYHWISSSIVALRSV